MSELESEITSLESKLTKLKEKSKESTFSKLDVKSIKDKRTDAVKVKLYSKFCSFPHVNCMIFLQVWRMRRRLCLGVLDAILESCPKTKKELMEEMEMETEENIGIAIPREEIE